MVVQPAPPHHPAAPGRANPPFGIHEGSAEECRALGQLMVRVYSALEGFPKPDEQPSYYEMLAGIGKLSGMPDTQVLVASAEGEVLGGVVYLSDMARYGAGGTVTQERDASAFRLLAVDPAARGRGIGHALMERCIDLAREHGHGQVIIHSTKAMEDAWKMYERRGFRRSPDLDFMQGRLPVFGFRLAL